MEIKNITIVNHDQTINNADLETQEGKIIKITPKEGMGDYYLVPGFIDTHIHGFYNYDVMQGKEACSVISKELAKQGTTSFMPTAMTGSMQEMQLALSNIANNSNWTSKFLGIHIEGPFIGLAKKGAHDPKYLIEATNKIIDQLNTSANGKLRKISFDPLMVSLDTMKHMQDNNIIPSIGHSGCNYALAEEYFNNGCDSVCHLWNAMSGVDSRNPGLLQAALTNNNCYVELICDLFHVSKESILFTKKNKDISSIIAVSDAIKPAYYQDGDNISGGIEVTKEGKKIVLKGTNTIAGSGICIHDAFVNLVNIGFSLNEAVAITSYNAARHLKLNDLGIIAVNKTADFVLLDKNDLSIKDVYINGAKIQRG
ncbi:N-acetylglucosamine-6-phosphate deacetylase [Mycoplasma sp. NEAQ87857]|uniref:N-acetylglucosamine-6-phosphate deacetylase n=1 Tax=Mycoplasma sp. NEAQ87857 TaxID=2683967 RepID=UPI001318119E|nr:N-acetylglucosamine-6-phosphate deacetylase [Mycoplasma sp. NEAQ87857]QGZ97527.1 N-acetylglucosamine-6-phosphate deacetylase [Mycoplasma sp. NEAQ87857]